MGRDFHKIYQPATCKWRIPVHLFSIRHTDRKEPWDFSLPRHAPSGTVSRSARPKPDPTCKMLRSSHGHEPASGSSPRVRAPPRAASLWSQPNEVNLMGGWHVGSGASSFSKRNNCSTKWLLSFPQTRTHTTAFPEVMAQPNTPNSNLEVGTKILVHIMWPLECHTLVQVIRTMVLSSIASFSWSFK